MARIQFVVNTTGLTGGIRVVFEYANRLQARGHDVTIVHALNLSGKGLPHKEGWTTLAKRIKFTFLPRVGWFPLAVPVLRVALISNATIPDADIVIATANETADWVATLAPEKGEKYYFIQHFEDWTRDPELVRNTWKLPLKKIVIASWMKKMAEEMGQKVVACISNGVNTDQFFPSPKEEHAVPRILMMMHPLAWKGSQDGLEALEKVRASGRAFELTLFGAYQPEQVSSLASTFAFRPTGESLRQLYASHDIFVSPSWSEGCQLPPMEAMACGCAVVATNVGGIPDYAIAGKTALVVDPKSPDQLAAAVSELIDSPGRLQEVAKAGERHIQLFTWEKATEAFEKALLLENELTQS